ncbi:uncharacterized protein LOC129320261 [Prosopis cineraria]|uniref:uncharacterized protein LOC129320261 n=1 Tax=Prosopis cineraria TaxID=364024 RepID=UPI00240F8108|nr:uncharacterized protein LOC129320261 [Prosopis cineraria]
MRSGGCKDHPDNKQMPGVCSSCLREKLSRLELIQCNREPLSPPNSAPTFDSCAEAASSNYASQAVYHRRRHRRNASDVMNSVSYSELGFDYGLKKSRSIAFASIDEVGASYAGKKYGFWSKLLKLTRKGTKNVSKHSTTTREGRG